MALDFPDSPTLDELHDGPGGQRWRWDGTKWVGLGNEGPPGEDGAAAGLARLVEPLTVPAIGGTVTVEVDDTQWIVPGLIVFVEGGPTFAVVAVNDPNITLMRLGSGTIGETGTAADLISVDAGNVITTGSDNLLFAPEPPNAKLGVTDGSDAAPGEIGELIIREMAAPWTMTATGSWISIFNTSLPAGDWDVEAQFSVSINAGVLSQFNCATGIAAGASVPDGYETTGAHWTFRTEATNGMGPLRGTTGMRRFNSNAAQTVYINAIAVQSGNINITARIRARRMR